MKCPKCHIENSDDNKFCRECGTALLSVCSECGNQLQAGDNFCGKCGQKVVKEAKEETTQLTSEGERKHVTVLFSDLSGYTAMSEKLDPEEVKEITGQIIGEVSKIIAKYDGFVEKYAGDAVMALFGVPRAHEDDPIRAIKAAREIHECVDAFSPKIDNKIGQRISMHSGINTGLVVTGEVDMDRGTHGVAGDTINVASRLSQLAQAGEVLVDSDTFQQSEGFFNFETLKPSVVKGKTEPVKVHKFLSAKKQPRKIHRLHGLRAALIGRKAEMAQLSEAVDNLRQGKGAVYSIIGTGGTGKSRLVEEFKASLDLKAIQWQEGNAFPYAQNIPYIPLIDLITKAIQINEGDSPATVKEKIESSLEVLIGENQDIAPYIGSLYALDYPEIAAVSPEFWKAELQKAILKVLTALAQRAPTVICLEDLHWADPSTIELVHFLLSEIRHPVLFLCVYRPIISPFSYHQIEAMTIPHQELHLQDLSLSEAQNMVESLLKTDAVPKDLQHFIRNKVEGNPLYLEEAINSLIESNILIPENGDWKVSGSIAESEISATIQGIISARVDRLEVESKRILQEASVIGRSFYYDILKRISEIKGNIDRSLRGLERFNLIKTKSIQPYLEYIFKHALTQEVVYNGLLKKERRDIHERIGYVIEELFKDRLPEFYETLAFHFKNGRSIDKAVYYLMRSGEKSVKRYSVDESHQSYQEAFDILHNKPDRTNTENELLINLIIDWSYVFYYRGDFIVLEELLRSHLNIAESLADQSLVGMFYAWLGNAIYFRGKLKESYQYLTKALAIGDKIDDKSIIAYACTWLTWACAEFGGTEEVDRFSERAQKVAKNFPSNQYLFFKPLGGLAMHYWVKGEGKKCLEIGKILVDYGRRHSNVRCLVVGYIAEGHGYSVIGDFPAAINAYEKALDASVDPFYSQWARSFVALGKIQYGQFEEAEKDHQKVLSYTNAYGCDIIGDWMRPFSGIYSIGQGKLSEGINMLEEGIKKMEEVGRMAVAGVIGNVLGSVYLQVAERKGPNSFSFFIKNLGFLLKNAPVAFKNAEECFYRAIEAAEKGGNKTVVGMANLNLGFLYKAKKRGDKSKECITKAVKIFEELEAEVFLKQAKEAIESLK